MNTLLASAIWYLEKWGMNPLFTNIWKRPLHREWSSFYMATLSKADIVREYNNIVSGGGKPAGVALIPSATSRIVVLDIDEVEKHGINPDAVASKLSAEFIVAVTPRRGLRIAFTVPNDGYLPHRIVIYRYGEKIGEGGGTFKHPWTFPPSVACVSGKEVNGKIKCLDVKPYYYVLPGGKKVKYPWQLPFRTPPTWKWEEAKDVLELELQIELSVATEVADGKIKTGIATGWIPVPIPCWRNLEEFTEWLETDGQPPLPLCVARALGYDVHGDEMVYTGKKIPHGLRFTMGASAVMFLAACIAEASPEEIVDYVGRNLEDYPKDTGEPLNTKLSRLLVRTGNIIVPRYMGLGSLAGNLPVEICRRCRYASRCAKGVELPGKVEIMTDKRRVWHVYAIEYWQYKSAKAKRYTYSFF